MNWLGKIVYDEASQTQGKVVGVSKDVLTLSLSDGNLLNVSKNNVLIINGNGRMYPNNKNNGN